MGKRVMDLTPIEVNFHLMLHSLPHQILSSLSTTVHLPKPVSKDSATSCLLPHLCVTPYFFFFVRYMWGFLAMINVIADGAGSQLSTVRNIVG